MKQVKKENQEIVLEISDLKKHFPGTKALDGVKLKLRKGKVTALMGENGAGKSTLLKTIFGIYKRTSGEMFFEGKAVNFNNPREALRNGISMVHQELQQVLTTSVVDNIWLGRFPRIGPFVNKAKTIIDTNKIFKDLNIKGIHPNDKISSLSISQRQMVEIAKAVSYDSKVLILDEPTSSLTSDEVKHLFSIIKKLQEKKVAILFVSHKISEVFVIADYIAIFRDGKYINEKKVENYKFYDVIKDMVGRDLQSQFPKRHILPKKAKNILTLKNFSNEYDIVENINFSLKEGEILGVSGLVGSGRTELVESIFGLRTQKKNSEMFYKGKKIQIKNPKMAIKNNIAMITEDRKMNGIFGSLDIEFNTTIGQIKEYTWPWGLLNKTLMRVETIDQVKKLDTKVSSIKQHIQSLSGGNQQKVIMSRWLVRKPDLFLMDEPTRGIDVGAKYAIYELIQTLATVGKSIIMISSEMEELMGVCNRIAVMSNGKLSGIVDAATASQEKIMELASKYY